MSKVAEHPKALVDQISGAAAKPKLLDEVRARIRRLNYSIHTEDTYNKTGVRSLQDSMFFAA